MKYSILYVASFVLGGIGAWLISRWGTAFGVLDRANHRSSHDGVVPKGGGIGILAAFLFACWVLKLPLLFWMCVGLVSVFSLYGDRHEIPPKVRLFIQFVAGIGLLVGLFHWEGVPYWIYLLIPFASVFTVGTANYYNFMDGINGIAGITGIVAFGLIVLFGELSGSHASLLILAGCMGFACLGFLPFNMPKARVFMGDVGSVLLGFVYAGLVVSLSHSLNDFVVLSSFLFPFYVDELSTTAVRIKDGENLLRPHRRHIYQLLANEKGIAHWKISLGYGILQLVVGVSAFVVKPFGLIPLVGVLLAYFLGFSVYGHRVRRSVFR